MILALISLNRDGMRRRDSSLLNDAVEAKLFFEADLRLFLFIERFSIPVLKLPTTFVLLKMLSALALSNYEFSICIGACEGLLNTNLKTKSLRSDFVSLMYVLSFSLLCGFVVTFE